MSTETKIQLVSPTEYNDNKREMYRMREEMRKKTGVACPECGKELIYPNPNMQLCSNPPKRDAECECGYHTYLIV